MNPFFQPTGSDTPIAAHIWEGLYKSDTDAQPVPALATSFEIVDRSTYVYKLRPGVKFWDGTEVTAEDIIWSFEAWTTQENPTASSVNWKTAVESVVATDAETITLTLNAPSPFQLQELGATRSWPVSSRAHYESLGDDAFQNSPMGTGPFKFVQNQVGVASEFEANEEYWNPEDVPYIRSVRLDVVPDQQTRIARLQTGEADIIDGIEGPLAASLEGDFQILRNPGTSMLRINFGDLHEAPWDDPRLREALQISIDQQSIVDNLLKMGAPAPNSPLLPSTQGFDASVFQVREYDPERAAALLEEADLVGFSFNQNTYSSTAFPLQPEIAQVCVAGWQEIGLEPNIAVQEAGAYLTKFGAGELDDIFHQPWIYSTARDARITLSQYFKTGSAFGTTQNIPELDAMIESMEEEEDPEAQLELALEAHRYIYDNFLILAGPYADKLFATNDRVAKWDLQAGSPYIENLETLQLSS